MRLDSVGEVIAERKLELHQGLDRSTVKVLMGKPMPFEDSLKEGYYCPFQVLGVGDEIVRYAGGVDAFQAIELAFRLIGMKLHIELREYKSNCTGWQIQTVETLDSRPRAHDWARPILLRMTQKWLQEGGANLAGASPLLFQGWAIGCGCCFEETATLCCAKDGAPIRYYSLIPGAHLAAQVRVR